jgi:hypothetical protein
MSMILLEPAYKILHTPVKFKRRTISVTPSSNPVFNPVFKALHNDRLPVAHGVV